ncbi:MAG TPA: DNA methyltransferase, partial [Solirubrobacteraceae bacterium]
MTVVHGDCLEVMATLDAESIDAVVTDPPYGIRFMGKAWDGADIEREYQKTLTEKMDLGRRPKGGTFPNQNRGIKAGSYDRSPSASRAFGEWCEAWARAALRVAKPGAYLLAFGGTRTVHRMTCAIEDAGWIIRDMLVWGYASGFPKGRANLKPAWEPIVMARKPGPLRMLAIDACRIGVEGGAPAPRSGGASVGILGDGLNGGWGQPVPGLGRWPANVVLTDPIFDGGWDGVVGGGETASGSRHGEYSSGEFFRGLGP